MFILRTNFMNCSAEQILRKPRVFSMNIKTLILSILIITGVIFSDFRLEEVEVTINDIDQMGGAHIQEVITFLTVGDLSHSLYDSGLYNNDLSFWANATQLKQVKFHVNPNKVDIQDFRLRPQPRKSCNSFTNSCRGQLIIDYKVFPLYSNDSVVNNTGLFFIKNEKPRTITYTVNPHALAFTTTNIGDIIIDKDITLVLSLPRGSIVTELNPFPEQINANLPQQINQLSWTNVILVRFVLSFQVEESLGKEVTDFFSDFIKKIDRLLKGEHGLSIVAITLILVGSYIYLNSLKYKKDRG